MQPSSVHWHTHSSTTPVNMGWVSSTTVIRYPAARVSSPPPAQRNFPQKLSQGVPRP